MNTVNYNVPSIHCMHCVHTIKTELSDLEGVKTVEADAATKKLVVSFEAPATEEKIEKLLEEINYPAVK
ncbi:MAG: heavy-metal-associated domain-containing protein [Anaerolineaceae bacterium]|jgi:copper chaperone|nr:heavy-metal-associated domain-containing protein [Anaerolineaceae bacterium]